MKIAIPFFSNRVSNRLDCCENFLIVTIEKGKIKSEKKIRLVKNRPALLANILAELKVDVLICGGITEFYTSQFNRTSIQVFPWIVGEVADVLNRYLQGKLINSSQSNEQHAK